MLTKSFKTFWSSTFGTHWFWSPSDQFCRTSLLQYKVWKMPKWTIKLKWLTSCRVKPMGPRDFFVHLAMIHMRTDFRACWWNVLWGLLFQGPFGKPYHTYIFTTTAMCAKFGQYLNILKPPKRWFTFVVIIIIASVSAGSTEVSVRALNYQVDCNIQGMFTGKTYCVNIHYRGKWNKM